MSQVDRLGRVMQAPVWIDEYFKCANSGHYQASGTIAVQPAISHGSGQYIIDCDSNPFAPKGFEVKVHLPGGQMAWGAPVANLYLSARQRGGDCIKGYDLYQEVRGQQPLNANALFFLLRHTHLITDSWKFGARGESRQVFFWGTLYGYIGHDTKITSPLYVLCLCWSGLMWYWDLSCLDEDFQSNSFAVLSA